MSSFTIECKGTCFWSTLINNSCLVGGFTAPGVSVTTPISLPGMPPITVSATLPYSAIEGLHIDASKQVPSSAAAI